MADRRRDEALATVQLICTVAILVVVLIGPKHHPSAGWIAADAMLAGLLMALLLARMAPAARRVRVDGWSAAFGHRPPFRRSAALPVLIIIVIAFIVQRLIS